MAWKLPMLRTVGFIKFQDSYNIWLVHTNCLSTCLFVRSLKLATIDELGNVNHVCVFPDWYIPSDHHSEFLVAMSLSFFLSSDAVTINTVTPLLRLLLLIVSSLESLSRSFYASSRIGFNSDKLRSFYWGTSSKRTSVACTEVELGFTVLSKLAVLIQYKPQ